MNYEDSRGLVNKFIEVANQLREEGVPMEHVNAAMMFASSTYATYFAAQGNAGFLNEGGVDKVMDAYRKNLTMVQDMRRSEAKAAGHDVSSADGQGAKQ